MIGLSYAQSADSHIRVDVFHMRFSRNSKNFWEIFGIVFFLIPFILVVFFNSLPFVAEAWRLNEMSDAPTGLPWRWLIKSVIPVSMLFLLASALSRLLRELAFFFGLNED
jgi:TRAP-type mannitol/chloroaromatic compound transport system permease small subunit